MSAGRTKRISGEGGRSGWPGSVLVGRCDNGRLCFAGQVGTGFTTGELTPLGHLLADLATGRCTFDPPLLRHPHLPLGSAPELVVEITFAGWTSTGTLSQVSYIAARDERSSRCRPHRLTSLLRGLNTFICRWRLTRVYEPASCVIGR